MSTGSLGTGISASGIELVPTNNKIQRLMEAELNEKGVAGEKEKNLEKVRQNTKILVVTAVAFTIFVIAEIIGALVSNSISLLGDAFAMSIDVITYLSNIYAERVKLDSPDGKTLSLKSQIVIDIIVPIFSTIALLSISIYVLISAIDVIKNYDADSETSGSKVDIAFLYGFASANMGIDLLSVFLFYSRGLSNFYAGHDSGHDDSDGNSDIGGNIITGDGEDKVACKEADEGIKEISNSNNTETSLISRKSSDSLVTTADNYEDGEIEVMIDTKSSTEPTKDERNVNMISAFVHVGCNTLRTLSVFAAAIVSSSSSIPGTLCDSWAAIIVTLTIFVMIVPLIREIILSYIRVRALYKKQQLSVAADSSNSEQQQEKLSFL